MADDDRVDVRREIAADAVRLYELVSDVTNMGRWSPETTACKWVGGATGPTVGAKFRGSNKDGWRRWQTTCTVVAAEPGKKFAFEVAAAGMKVARWTYTFEANGTNTTVTETWEDLRPALVRGPSKIIMGDADRAGHNRAGMETTLGRLAEHAV